MSSTISSQVFLSRDQIRNQLIDYAKDYLELENIDLAKSSFLSYIINTFSTLTSNLLFYQLSTNREFYLTQAQIPENILNLSSYIGYIPSDAKYSNTDILLTIPMTFSNNDTIHFIIPEKFKFTTPDKIGFSTYYSVDITIINNNNVNVVLTQTIGNLTSSYNLPVSITENSSGKFLSFILNLRQYITNEFEFQIDSDLVDLQFVTIDVSLTGKVSSMSVFVSNPGNSSETEYTEFSSLFLMGPNDYGYVSRRTTSGKKIYFGNGIIGKQPPSGSKVRVVVLETLGSDGNIISGSINSGDRLYVVDQGQTKIVNYKVVNPGQAINGKDEESLDEIRRNSIANIVALNRLVSEIDFINTNKIIKDSPIGQNSLPILKRSDVKTNEIQLFTTLLYNNSIVPTRNLNTTVNINTEKIPRGTVINYEGDNYTTLFDIIPNSISQYATYQYILTKLEIIPSLDTNFGSTYNFKVDKIKVYRTDGYLPGSAAKFELYFTSSGVDSTSVACLMEVVQSGTRHDLVYDQTSHTFVTTIDPYEKIPENNQKFILYLTDPHGHPLANYSINLSFRQTLNDFMLSNAVISDTTNLIIYDIPGILTDYYNSTNQLEFELLVLQKLLFNMEFSRYKMVTDFINLKFSNTYGLLTNMKYNTVTRLPVSSRTLTTIPINPVSGDRYIVNGNEGGNWQGKNDYFSEWVQDGTNSGQWTFTYPSANDIVYVTNENKKYIFTDIGWRYPEYQIPLNIEIHIFKDPSTTSSYVELSNTIKSTIVSTFKDRFGINNPLYKSEIIRTVQNISGVSHCRLLKPESDIFFNFELSNLDQNSLLEYGPEYIYFNENNITVKIF